MEIYNKDLQFASNIFMQMAIMDSQMGKSCKVSQYNMLYLINSYFAEMLATFLKILFCF